MAWIEESTFCTEFLIQEKLPSDANFGITSHLINSTENCRQDRLSVCLFRQVKNQYFLRAFFRAGGDDREVR